jgi:hypothetical protein
MWKVGWDGMGVHSLGYLSSVSMMIMNLDEFSDTV